MNNSAQLLHEILGGRASELNPITAKILSSVPAATIQETYSLLLELGLTREKIATNAQLLGRDPETIRQNAEALQQLGLTREKIASRAELLGRDPETIRQKYQFLRRFFQRKQILEKPVLLGNSQETIEGSVQFLHSLGVDYEAHPYVGTTPACKRHKIAVLLRERYGYSRDLDEEEKKELIAKAREFVRKNPAVLFLSEDKIKKKFCA